MTKIAIVGTVGLPANYGGFETLAENLVLNLGEGPDKLDLSVYCSTKAYSEHPTHFKGAQLRYISLDANGPQSVLYDALSLFDACRKGDDVVLLLGVSGALFIPIAKLFWNIKVVTNIDGLEWRRAKWGRLARAFLKFSERIAVRFSDTVVCDNQAISDHVTQAYGAQSTMIAYGGDQAFATEPGDIQDLSLPADYALGLCRIEPENNVEMILNGFSKCIERKLVFVGNWNASDYGKNLRQAYSTYENITLLDPIYDAPRLRAIRDGAEIYVHGHSAGGTNPSLVEMMHFGIPVLAFDCTYNRYSTEDQATYFSSASDLRQKVEQNDLCDGSTIKSIANKRYCWAQITSSYSSLFKPLPTEKRLNRRRDKRVFVVALMALCGLLLSSCGVLYISPSVKTDDDQFPVSIIPVSFQTIETANKSTYKPLSLPKAFYQFIPASSATSEVANLTLPMTPQDGGINLDAKLPPKIKSKPYRIGVGDVVALQSDVENGTELPSEGMAKQSLGYSVRDDGAIVVPSIGAVQIAGRTLSESNQLIFDRLLAQGRDPGISVDILEFNSQFVTLGGAVGAPGRIPLKMSPMTLNEAIAKAAGLRLREDRAGVILIARGNDLYQIPMNLYKRTPALQKTLLQSEDAIFVEENYDVEQSLAFFERQIQLAGVRNNERSGAMARLTQRLSHRRNALDEQRRSFEMRDALDAVPRDYVYLAGETDGQARFTLPYQRHATLADVLFSEGGINVPFGDPREIYILRIVQTDEDAKQVTAYHLDSRNAARLSLATELQMRPNDVIFVEEQPIAKWERSLRSIWDLNVTHSIK
ncbi:DUF1972 domain-containing protein [Epibacterium ulvae]|uniref:DUF1972 domain-containing protein n=1 Tax=Epibacterium ulvae TaxID=1156985 RepID=UPI002491E013|nr:DUF1972 domain-containing protein [Epibacterium ulvae]